MWIWWFVKRREGVRWREVGRERLWVLGERVVWRW